MSEPSEKSFVEHPYVQGLLLKCGEAEQMAATDEPHTEVELAIAFQAAAIAETVLDAARCGGPDAVKSALK